MKEQKKKKRRRHNENETIKMSRRTFSFLLSFSHFFFAIRPSAVIVNEEKRKKSVAVYHPLQFLSVFFADRAAKSTSQHKRRKKAVTTVQCTHTLGNHWKRALLFLRAAHTQTHVNCTRASDLPCESDLSHAHRSRQLLKTAQKLPKA